MAPLGYAYALGALQTFVGGPKAHCLQRISMETFVFSLFS